MRHRTGQNKPTANMKKVALGPYEAPHGIPFFWKNEQTGKLREAIKAYLDNRLEGKSISPVDCQRVTAYLVYFIHAPVWDKNPHGNEEIIRLREAAVKLTDADSIARWIDEALDSGIDPL